MNEHITEYLDYYFGLEIDPKYALLLKGKWGCGKSWYIRKYLEDRPHLKYLFVSLNGLSKPKEIEEEFFRQLHPIMASKGMKIAGKIMKGLIKTTIKIDLDNDNKEDASIASQIPDVELNEFFKNADNRILIFDDLERCAIPVPQILGYINQFVENLEIKVVVIANEEEVIKKESTYLEIKEKLFGRGFEVSSDIDSAVKNFVSYNSDEKVREVLVENTPFLKELYKKAGYNNLRHLQQSILDFGRFYTFLPTKVIEDSNLFSRVFELFFVMSFEIRKGRLREDEIDRLLHFKLKNEKKDEAETSIDIIRKKYDVFEFYPYPINAKIWMDFMSLGTINRGELELDLNKTLFKNDNFPDFIKLWHQYDLEDSEFEIIQKKVFERFKKCLINDKYELIHVVGLMLDLSERKIILNKKNTIIEIAKRNVVNLKSKGLLLIGENEEFPGFASYGLGYTARETTEFKDFAQFIIDKANQAKDQHYAKKASELLRTFESSIYNFIENITLSNSPNNLYYNIPILKFIKPREFVKAYLQHTNRDKKHFAWRFDKRYQFPEMNKELLPEVEWLKDVQKLIISERNRRKSKISGSNMDIFLTALKASIEKFEPTPV
ncbi:MAG: hypothetical protein IM592_16255 [Bacteroidetes bacterium]|nr:hypothetical protein [Bacteroidota bacterium]